MTKNISKAAVFLLIFALLLKGFTVLVTPSNLSGVGWTGNIRFLADDTNMWFYNQPENTVEAVFIGPSTTLTAVSPSVIYEKYGLCTYNLAVSGQNIALSYNWLREAYKRHPETLKVVVLDAGTLRSKPTINGHYERGVYEMKYSKEKYHAVKDLSDTLENFMKFMSPVFAYHIRWKELTDNDFKLTSDKEIEVIKSHRGYSFEESSYYDQEYIPHNIGEEKYEPGDYSTLNETGMYYFRLIDSFCRERGIKLVLLKTPANMNWGEQEHYDVSTAAEEYGVDLLDFNTHLYGEIGFNSFIDAKDTIHTNYYGAEKLSDYIGRYLSRECGLHDVRGLPGYSFMDRELELFRTSHLSFDMKVCGSAAEYLRTIIGKSGYTVFVSVRPTNNGEITESDREILREIGMEKLAELDNDLTYLAVISDNGTRIYEEAGSSSGDALVYEGEAGGISYVLKSNKYGCECRFSSDPNLNTIYTSLGLNISVYDEKSGETVDKANFITMHDGAFKRQSTDLAAETERYGSYAEMPDSVKKYYLYSRIEKNSKRAADIRERRSELSISEYLGSYTDRDYIIAITGMGMICEMLDEKKGLRREISSCGLTELSEAGLFDKYIGIMQGDKVLQEVRSKETDDIYLDIPDISVHSSLFDSGITICGEEVFGVFYGINIAVYDRVTGKVVDFVRFDSDGAHWILGG